MDSYGKIIRNIDFKPGKDWLTIKTIDMPTGGEPLRDIVDGFPQIKGNSVLERRRYLMEHHDYLRTSLMFESRGHADMYGCLLVLLDSPGADFGIIFMHNEGYSTMCGHATLAIAKLAVELAVETGQSACGQERTLTQPKEPCGSSPSMLRSSTPITS